MSADDTPEPPAQEARVMDYPELENLLGAVIRAMESGTDTEASTLWAEFASALDAHFAREERVLVAPMLVSRPREASVVLEEHRHLRRRVAQLEGSRALRSMRAFLAELRAHGRHEDRVLYRWSDALPSPTG